MSLAILGDLPAMDADAFVAWQLGRAGPGRFELEDGQVLQMPTEGFLHSEVSIRVASRLLAAIESAGIEAQVFGSQMDVRISERRVFEPDVTVRLGPRRPAHDTLVDDPVIVVEVLSPSTAQRDLTVKLQAYLSLSTLQHYLVVDANERRVVHHRRVDIDRFESRIHGDEPIVLDPPGLSIDRLFP